jgi:hypothetical protein
VGLVWLVLSCVGGKRGAEDEGLYTLFVHALLDGVFVVGLGGVLECAAEACRCHFRRSGCCIVLGRSRGVSGRLQVYISCSRVKGGFLRRQQCSVNGGMKVSWVEIPDMTFWGACTWTLKLARQPAITSVTGSSHYSSFSNTLSKAFLFIQN